VTQATGSRLEQRLRRILVMLPYAIRHPGTPVSELSRRFEVSPEDVLRDLELAFLCGLPGYGPGDLIEVAIEEGRVFVDMADYFGAPLRLSPAEALALYAAGQAVAALPGSEQADALQRALAKLGRALGLDGADEAGVTFMVAPGPASHLARLQEALRTRRRVRLDYLSASRGRLTARAVDPWALVVAWGRSYLVGWDHLSAEERIFRTDRIKAVEITEEPAPVPPDFDAGRYEGAFVERGGERVVRLQIAPEAARWFADYYPVRSVRRLRDGWRAVELVSDSDHWAANLVLRLGDQVRSVEPDEVVRRARALAVAVAAGHAQAVS
jgi:predicted DNA-binding transcriptional regulator YafY